MDLGLVSAATRGLKISWARQSWRKLHTIGRFDTQEDAAHAVNAAIRRAGLAGRRRAASPPRAKDDGEEARPRRVRRHDDSEPDEDEEDLELGPPDADDGWD